MISIAYRDIPEKTLKRFIYTFTSMKEKGILNQGLHLTFMISLRTVLNEFL